MIFIGLSRNQKNISFKSTKISDIKISPPSMSLSCNSSRASKAFQILVKDSNATKFSPLKALHLHVSGLLKFEASLVRCILTNAFFLLKTSIYMDNQISSRQGSELIGKSKS